MANTVTIDAKTLEQIVSQLDKLTKDMAAVKKRLMSEEPPYGSEAWWSLSDKKALEDYKKGDYTTFQSAEEMQKHLNSLKRKK